MDVKYLERLSKVGLSITTIGTVLIYYIGECYYNGIFSFHNVPDGFIEVDFSDKMSLNHHSIGFIFSIAFGVIFCHHFRSNTQFPLSETPLSTGPVQYEKRDSLTEIPFSTGPVQKIKRDSLSVECPWFLELLFIVFLFLYFVFSMISAYYTSSWYPVVCSFVGTIMGCLLYYFIHSRDLTIRTMFFAFTVGLLLLHALVSGAVSSSMESLISATITLKDDEVISNSRILHKSSSALFILSSEDDSAVTRISMSDISKILVMPEIEQ